MESINNWVLSVFASNDRFNNQVESLRRRYHTLNLIYINLFIMIIALLLVIVVKYITNSSEVYIFALEIFPLLIFDLFLIHKKKLEMANIVLALNLLLSAKIITDHVQSPLITMLGLMIFPYYLLFSSGSVKPLVINFIFSVELYYRSSIQVYDMYKVAISEEQTNQIMAFLWLGIVIMCGISLLAIFQKTLEIKVWSLAHENYNKCENFNKEMILAMEAKDRFISMISHEIRNPLNALKGSVDYLIQVEGNPGHITVLKNAQLSGEILLNLVNNVLDAAKLKSDKIEIHRSDANFIEIVKKVFMVNSELLKEKKLIAKAHIDEKLTRHIWIDGSRLLQILLNLMSNAVKFTPKGGKIEIYAEWCSANENKENLLKPIVQLANDQMAQEESLFSITDVQEMSADSFTVFHNRCDQVSSYNIKKVGKQQKKHHESKYQAERDLWELNIIQTPRSHDPFKRVARGEDSSSESLGHLKIHIVDTGYGIAASDIPKLFGMFEQATEHSRNVRGGSGLGLWICKQICQKMNGDIMLYSELGKGSSFVFYIPIQSNNQSSRVFTEVDLTAAKNKIKALVVDDFAMNRYINQLLLEQQGVQVVKASNGKEAIEKYKAGEEYSFILMDVNMPVMDGFIAAKKIREWEIENNMKRTDIYFVTGEYFNEADVFSRFKNVGGLNNRIKYLNKPLDSDTLKKIIIQYQ